jgi:hypothetical protein
MGDAVGPPLASKTKLTGFDPLHLCQYVRYRPSATKEILHMPNYKIPHSLEVAAVIRANVAAGVPMRITFDQIKEMKGGPRSYKTLYSTYRGDIVDARASLHAVVGKAIMDKALVDGDMQALTLIAKGRLGWSEKLLVEEVDSDDVDEDNSAIDTILAMLKLKSLRSE